MIRSRNKSTAFQELLKVIETKKSGTGGGVSSIVGGDNVTVDTTDPENPEINVDVGIKNLVSESAKVTVDKTDPDNTKINVTGFVEDILEGANIVIDRTNPAKLIISSTGGGGGGSLLQSYVERITINNTIIADKKITLSFTVNEPSKIQVSVWGGILQLPNIDYTVDGNDIKWESLALELLLNNTDVMVVTYVGL